MYREPQNPPSNRVALPAPSYAPRRSGPCAPRPAMHAALLYRPCAPSTHPGNPIARPDQIALHSLPHRSARAARPRHPRFRLRQSAAPSALAVAPSLRNRLTRENSLLQPPSSTNLHSLAVQPLSRLPLAPSQNCLPVRESTAPPACPPPIPAAPVPPRSTLVAAPSTASSTQTDSTARAMAAPINHPAIPKVRCGTAPEVLRRDRADRRVETRLPTRAAFPVLHEAARRKWRTGPNGHRSVLAPVARLHHKRKTPAAGRYHRSAAGVAR